jgi:hypothetical protein
MAIATTVSRVVANSGYMGTVNLRIADSTGVSAATPLTINGDLVLTPVHALPNGAWKCEVTATPRGSNRLIIRVGDAVTG